MARSLESIETLPEATALVSLEGQFLSVNAAFCDLLGYTAQELLGSRVRDLTHPDDRPQSHGVVERALQVESAPVSVVKRYIHGDGRTIWGHLTTCLRTSDGVPSHFFSQIVDIDQRLAEDHLLGAFAKRVQTIAEHERQRIARELHDELGQIFTALKLELHLLEKGTRTGATAAIRELVDESVACVRRLTQSLHPPILEDLGLESALEWLLKDVCERAELSWSVIRPPQPVPLDWETRVALFRICQEALNNVLRHSGASAVEVCLEQEGDELTLTVHDNGCGLSGQPRSGLGLLSMRERAVLLGGRFSAQTHSRGGTLVAVTLPLSPSPGMHRRMPREHWE